MACPTGFLIRVLIQLRIVLDHCVCVVSACCICVECILYFLCCIFQRRKNQFINCIYFIFLFQFFETQNAGVWASGQNESKMGIAWFKNLPESGRYCNQVVITWSLLSCCEGFPTRVLLQLHGVLERAVRVVSACCINVLYACCIFCVVFFKGAKSVDHWEKLNLKNNENQYIRIF